MQRDSRLETETLHRPAARPCGPLVPARPLVHTVWTWLTLESKPHRLLTTSLSVSWTQLAPASLLSILSPPRRPPPPTPVRNHKFPWLCLTPNPSFPCLRDATLFLSIHNQSPRPGWVTPKPLSPSCHCLHSAPSTVAGLQPQRPAPFSTPTHGPPCTTGAEMSFETGPLPAAS